MTYQLETEFKKNRQAAILEGMQELKKTPPQISRPGIFSDAKASKMMAKGLKDIEKRMVGLRRRLARALENPAVHDPVYKACQRVFHKQDDLTLNRENPLRRTIRRRAFRRFLHGCPPRKNSDTSIGDGFNWEWMVHCATQRKAGLGIVTRDSDYGATVEGKCYINDHLRQEFSERVSRKRDLLLYPSLSDALRTFKVEVSPQEEEAEKELASTMNWNPLPMGDRARIRQLYGESIFETLKVLGLENELMTVKGSAAATGSRGIWTPTAEKLEDEDSRKESGERGKR